MPAEVLSRRALNRALLARQHLLARQPGPALAMVEHLIGLQAQAPFPPYYGLLARLDGFRPEDLAGLLVSRDVVRIALMRGTIHLVSADDALTLRPLVQPVLDRALASVFGKRLAGADLAAGGRLPDAAAGLRRRAGPGAVRPAGRAASRPGGARTGPAAPGVRQHHPVPRRPHPDHV
jgi:hypothetical protein